MLRNSLHNYLEFVICPHKHVHYKFYVHMDIILIEHILPSRQKMVFLCLFAYLRKRFIFLCRCQVVPFIVVHNTCMLSFFLHFIFEFLSVILILLNF